MEGTGMCDVCQKAAHQRCAGCHNAFYCSKEHQKAAWKEHKKTCKPYMVCQNEELGRYFVATKDIKPGDIILQEEALLWGPLQITTPVCLGCGNAVNSKNCVPCSKCAWPLCSKKCEHSLSHIPECHYAAKAEEKIKITDFDVPHPYYQCITPLRCLYQKKFDPDLWARINTLQSHHEERQETGRCAEDKATVVKFIHDFFNLANEFTEEEILKVCGIIMVNGHEVPLSIPSNVAFFEKACIIEHRCRANCYKTFTPQGKLLVVAGVPIEKGQNITISYTDAFWTTFTRRKHLLETKFFSCECDRCVDVTEFGTYFSAIKCQKGKCDGLLLPATFLNDSCPWVCGKCKDELKLDDVELIMKNVQEGLHTLQKGDIEACRTFLDYYEKLLPSNHFYMVDVKLALIQLIAYGLKVRENAVSNDDLTFEIKLGHELVELIKVIAPGEKRVEGSLAFDLHNAIAEMGRRKASMGLIGPADLISILLDSKKFLVESVECLKYEPIILPEGQLYLQAQENLMRLEGLLRTLVEGTEKA